MARHLVQQPRSVLNLPVFLTPAFSVPSSSSTIRQFSSTSSTLSQVKRGNRDKSKKRGVSVIRSTGPRQPLPVSRLGPLPKPVADPSEARAAFETNPNHGLWGFFNDNKEAILPPAEEDAYGRPWTMQELAKKGLEDLHKLYWVCVKEANVIRTRNNERKRLRVGYGVQEAIQRLKVVKRTMFRIRQTLIDRHYAHFDAKLLLNEKNLYELFPDVLRDEVMKEGLLDEEASQELSSLDESSQSVTGVSTDSAVAQDIHDRPRQQRQTLTQ